MIYMQKLITQEENRQLIERLKSDVSIVDYAQKIGLTVKRVGRYYTTKEHDSLRIDPDRNIYFRNSRDRHKGSIMDFMIEFGNVNNFHEAMIELTSGQYSYHRQPYNTETAARKLETSKKEFILPERDDNVKNVYAYLISTRKIDKDIVSNLMRKGYIKQDKRKNCLFIGYDNPRSENKKAVFACLRGTNTKVDKPFKGDVSGNDYSKGFYIDNGSKTMYVSESPIDTLSIMTLLKRSGKNPFEYDYLALAGVCKADAVYSKLNTEKLTNLVLCLDGDEAGIAATKEIQETIEKKITSGEYPKINIEIIKPINKDFNDDLCNNAWKTEKKHSTKGGVMTRCHNQKKQLNDYEYTL